MTNPHENVGNDDNGLLHLTCGDCGVAIGQLHSPGCDLEQCPECGGQALSCACMPGDRPRLPWTGNWPGVSACTEFGWWAHFVNGVGWVPCAASDERAVPDLNRLLAEAHWDADAGRFVKRA